LADGQVKAPDGFAQAYQQFVAAGWNALGGQPDYGGQNLPHIVSMPVQEIWNSANMAFCLCPMLTTGVVEAMHVHGSVEQQRLFLPKLTTGEWAGTMNLTEPQAGSDLSAVRTRATPEGDHYRLRGTKIFITWGEHDMSGNIVHLVLARTPDAPEGVKGISLFVVPKYLVNADGTLGQRNDVKCVSIEHKLGIHASPTCVLSYGEEKGAIGYLVGEENRGLEYMFTMMNHARLGVGIEGGACAAGLELAGATGRAASFTSARGRRKWGASHIAFRTASSGALADGVTQSVSGSRIGLGEERMSRPGKPVIGPSLTLRLTQSSSTGIDQEAMPSSFWMPGSRASACRMAMKPRGSLVGSEDTMAVTAEAATSTTWPGESGVSRRSQAATSVGARDAG